MLHFGEASLGSSPGCTIREGPAEAIPLPDHSVNLVTTPHAIQWFDATPARREMVRILTPGGWLAVVWYIAAGDHGLSEALAAIMISENGVEASSGSNARPVVPLSFYFSPDGFRTLRVPFTCRQGWITLSAR